MSYIMHIKREQCLEFCKRHLKEKDKVSIQEMKVEIMRRFSFSKQTAENYIRDLVDMGIAKQNGKHLTYVFDKPQEKKSKEKEEKT